MLWKMKKQLPRRELAGVDIPIEEDDLEVPTSSPGTHLRGLRYREDLAQAQLAELVGIPRHHISEMENDKRPIGKKNARKLADMFKTDPRMFLSA